MPGTLYIIRGIPGSGKSTLARKLVHESRIREADQYFVRGGSYRFDRTRLHEAHKWCQDEVEHMLRLPRAGDVAVANTFVRQWEYDPYLILARKYGYVPMVIECHGPWKNVHGVPDDVIERMRGRWEPHHPGERCGHA